MNDILNVFIGLQQVHQHFDNAEKEVESQTGVPICIEGCWTCCLVNTPFAYEAEAAYAVSRLSGEGKLSEILSLTEGWLLERHKEALTYEGMVTGWVTPKLKEEWVNLWRLPCPFLQRGCLVYSVRPIPCRAFGVTRVGDICPRPLGRGETISCKAYFPGDEPGSVKDKLQDWTHMVRALNLNLEVVGFFPTVLFRQAKPEKFRELIFDNKIATAKLIGMKQSPALLWQTQQEAVWRREPASLAVE